VPNWPSCKDVEADCETAADEGVDGRSFGRRAGTEGAAANWTPCKRVDADSRIVSDGSANGAVTDCDCEMVTEDGAGGRSCGGAIDRLSSWRFTGS
jgi:hypothetical protein